MDVRLIALGALVVAGCDAGGAKKSEAGDSGPAAHSVEPGVCLGTRTRCEDAPAAAALGMVSLDACEPVDHSADANVVWTTQLGQFDCPQGECSPEATGIVLDRSGGIWLQSQLDFPPGNFLETRPHGLGLSRVDAEGKVVFSSTIDFRTPLAGDAPDASGMRVTASGHLLLLAPMPGRPGLELREYDRSGRLSKSRPLVDLARSGRAFIDPDGALTLVYSYEPPGDAGSTDPLKARVAFDVARFDANGTPVWNQTISSQLWPDRLGVFRVIAASSAKATAVLVQVPAGPGPGKALAATLDDDGNVTWVGAQQDATWGPLIVTGPKAFAAAYQPMVPQGAPDYLTALGADDAEVPSSARATLSASSGQFSLVTDARGRFWSDGFDFDGNVVVRAVSSDGTSCSSWAMDTGGCIKIDGENYCIGTILAPADDDKVYFAAAGNVGLVQLGGVP